MNTKGRRGKGRPRRAAFVESPIVQGKNLILEEEYVENSTANGGGGYENNDDIVTQAMLRVLQRIARAQTGIRSRGSDTERIRSNGVEPFKGILG